MTRSRLGFVPVLFLGGLLGACQAATPGASNPAAATPTAIPVVTAAPTSTPGPDTAALLAARYEQVTSGVLRLDGTLVIGTVQATFAGTSKSNGPDEASTMTTTIGGQASTEQRVRVGGTRYIQRGNGPWLVDPCTCPESGVGTALKRALKVAVDLDAGAGGSANHRIQAADQSFDAVSFGFAKEATRGRATYSFVATPDGTPVSVTIAATWTQPGEAGPLDVRLDLTLTYGGLNSKPRIDRPEAVWQSFASDRWGYAVAFPNDYDYSKDKDGDYFIAPTNGLVTVNRADASGYTVNQFATAELASMKQLLKSRTGTNDAVSLGGVKARLLSVSGTHDGVKVTTFQALAVHGKFVYALVWFAESDDDAAQRATFDQMLSTFRFT